MLLQTNSYVVPKEKRAEHARLIRRFRLTLARIGCDQFDVYEQIGANWDPAGANGRYVQLMRFRDYAHQQAVQQAEREDPGAQAIIAEFCNLINFPYQQQHGYFASGFYTSVLPVGPRASDNVPGAPMESAPAEPEPTPIMPPISGSSPDAAPEAGVAADPATGELDHSQDAVADLELEHIEPVCSEQSAPWEDATEQVEELGTFGLSLSGEEQAEQEITPSPLLESSHDPLQAYSAADAEASSFDSTDDSDLLDLSAIELSEDDVALHEDLAEESVPEHSDEPAFEETPLMLSAALPEDDAEMLEFNAFLQEIKEGPAEQEHPTNVSG